VIPDRSNRRALECNDERVHDAMEAYENDQRNSNKLKVPLRENPKVEY